eukprot:m.70500 g.70500  ORF g.70500 m.70500 type:complete len:303 (+) comp12139_c0_seq2:73-981(+)
MTTKPELMACATCGKDEKDSESTLLRCKRCQKVWYCGRDCQTKHWPTHKTTCKDRMKGCEHYRRGCQMKAPCCGDFFPCRICHDSSESLTCTVKFDRKLVQEIKCNACHTVQGVSNLCVECGLKFGEYFCEKCRLWDEDTSKQQFHCDGCGLCRVGGASKHKHCDVCCVCYALDSFDGHVCTQNALDANCPVCLEFLHDSTKRLYVPLCGHFLHHSCFLQLSNSSNRCPTCNKSLFQLNNEAMDIEIANTPMPLEYRDWIVDITCNDCNKTTETVPHHILGHKCGHCGSYNTAITSGPHRPD